MDIDDLRVYQLSMQLAEKVWEIVVKWDSFAKYSIGRQYTEAADSIGANITSVPKTIEWHPITVVSGNPLVKKTTE